MGHGGVSEFSTCQNQGLYPCLYNPNKTSWIYKTQEKTERECGFFFDNKHQTVLQNLNGAAIEQYNVAKAQVRLFGIQRPLPNGPPAHWRLQRPGLGRRAGRAAPPQSRPRETEEWSRPRRGPSDPLPQRPRQQSLRPQSPPLPHLETHRGELRARQPLPRSPLRLGEPSRKCQ